MDNSAVLFTARGVPISPELTRVISQPNGTSLKVAWSDEKFVRTGYNLYTSADGINWGAPISLGSSIQIYIDSSLSKGVKKYYKVSVVGTGGQSKPSRVYGAMAGGSPRVLIVDGDDRWQFQTAENPTCTNHSFCAIAAQNISGIIFETATHNAVIDGTVALTNYAAVVWLMGEESTQDETFSATEQALVTSYLNAGGNLFVSGSEIAWDLDRTGTGPTSGDRDFYHNVLRAVYSADDANTYAFAPLGTGIFAGNASGGFDNGTHGTYNVDFPDVLLATNGSVPCITYTGGTGGNAALSYDGSLGGGKIVNWGFPFETVTNSATRDAYMSDVLRFFRLVPAPMLLIPGYDRVANKVTLSWSANAGLTYRVQYTTDLNPPNWQPLAGDVTATNTIATKADSPGVSQRFYRVLLLN